MNYFARKKREMFLYLATKAQESNYTELTISDAGSYTLNIYKEDTQETSVYVNNELVATSTTSGSQDIPITTSSANSVVKIANAGDWYFDSFCLGNIPKNNKLVNIDFANESKMTRIGANSIRNNRLNSIIIPSSVTSIGNSALSGCAYLTSIIIPDNVTSIGTLAFASCSSLESVTIGSGVTSIGNGIFNTCSNLSTITVDSNNNYFKDDNNRALLSKDGTIFYTYANLSGSSYTIPSNVTDIMLQAFYGCNNLISVIIPNGVRVINTYAFQNCSSLISIDVPESVTAIETGTFSGCSSLVTATIGNSVTRIDTSVFSGCTSLTTFTIPASVENIKANVFSGCTSLATLNVYSSSSLTTIYYASGSWVNNCSSSLIIHALSTLDATSSQTAFGTYWNYINSSTMATTIYDLDASNRTELTISTAGTYTLNLYKQDTEPTKIYVNDVLSTTTTTSGSQDISVTTPSANSVVKIQSDGDWYFDSLCLGTQAKQAKLVNVNFANESKMTQVGSGAFSYTTNLSQSLELPSSVTSIAYGGFSGAKITSLTIPSSVTSIGQYAFYGCAYLTSVNCLANTLELGQGAFEECSSLTIFTTLSSATLNIGQEAFYNCENLTSFNIQNGTIGTNAFGNSQPPNNLSVIIGSGVTSIGSKAFYLSTRLSLYIYTTSSSFKATSVNDRWVYDATGATIHAPSSLDATTSQTAFGTYWNYISSSSIATTYYDL